MDEDRMGVGCLRRSLWYESCFNSHSICCILLQATVLIYFSQLLQKCLNISLVEFY